MYSWVVQWYKALLITTAIYLPVNNELHCIVIQISHWYGPFRFSPRRLTVKKILSHFSQFNFKPHNHELVYPRKWWSQRELILSSQSWRIILLCALLLDTLWQIFNFHLFSNQRSYFLGPGTGLNDWGGRNRISRGKVYGNWNTIPSIFCWNFKMRVNLSISRFRVICI